MAKSNSVDVNEVEINGVTYTRKDVAAGNKAAEKLSGMPYCVVRCAEAGAFAGYVEERNGTEATLRNVRRLWYWAGAASLSQLAVEGVKRPAECKFPVEIPKIEVTGVIEVIECTEKAKKSIASVPVWEA